MAYKKPGYYKELEDKLDGMEDRQREFRETVDGVLVKQSEQMNRMNQIHFLLAGTEYEENDGGLVGEIGRMKKEVHKNTIWRVRMMAVVSFVVLIGGTVVAWLSSVVDKLKN